MQDWDPIGVKDEPAAHDEYDSYVPVICGMLQGGKSVKEVADYLSYVQSELMYPGMGKGPEYRERLDANSLEISNKLLKLKV